MDAKARQQRTNKPKADLAKLDELAQMVAVGLHREASHEEIERVRAWLAANPDELSRTGHLATEALRKVVDCETTWVMEREGVKARMEELKRSLGYDSANQIEQLAITQVVLNWARLYFLENNLSQATKGAHNRETARYWDRRVTMAQGRYNQALTTLAKIRKLKLPDITAIQAQTAIVNVLDSPVEMQARKVLPAQISD